MFTDTNTFAHACAYKYGNSNAHILVVIQTHIYKDIFNTHMYLHTYTQDAYKWKKKPPPCTEMQGISCTHAQMVVNTFS